MQTQLAYSDEDLQLFKGNARNADILSRAPELMNKTIIVMEIKVEDRRV